MKSVANTQLVSCPDPPALEVSDIVALREAVEPKATKRGIYEK
jgi:hypothetical protein